MEFRSVTNSRPIALFLATEVGFGRVTHHFRLAALSDGITGFVFTAL